MSADEHEAGHADCALVIAEVWTLLDGECTMALATISRRFMPPLSWRT